jgi:hypothetical protein
VELDPHQISYATPSPVIQLTKSAHSAPQPTEELHFKPAMASPSTTSEATSATNSFTNSTVKQMSLYDGELNFHNQSYMQVACPIKEKSSSLRTKKKRSGVQPKLRDCKSYWRPSIPTGNFNCPQHHIHPQRRRRRLDLCRKHPEGHESRILFQHNEQGCIRPNFKFQFFT